MGCSNNGQASINNNKRLRTRNFHSFKQKKLTSKLGVFNEDFLTEEQESKIKTLTQNDFQDRIKHDPSPLVKVSLFSIVLLGIIFIGKLLVISMYTSYNNQQEYISSFEIKAARSNSENIRRYHDYTNLANHYLKRNLLGKAQHYFIYAQKVKPTGQKANYGLTEVLIQQCKQNNAYCQEAKAYLSKLNNMELKDDLKLREFNHLMNGY